MPVTKGHSTFASINESGFNKFIHDVYVRRRYYFHYATPPLGSGVIGVDFEELPPLPIPGTDFGIPFSIDLSEPRVDFTPTSGASPIPLGANQFSIAVDEVQVCILCGMHIPLPQQPRGRDQRPFRQPDREKEQPETVCTTLKVFAVGHPTVVSISPTDWRLGLQLDEIRVENVCDLEKIVECVAKATTNALLDKIQFTLTRIALATLPVSLALAEGPQIADDQLKVWAEFV